LRFELWNTLKNWSDERIFQANKRALYIFEYFFWNIDEEIWLFVRDYENELFSETPKFLYEILPNEKLVFLEKYKLDEVLVKDKYYDFNLWLVDYKKIFEWIINLEMWRMPDIPQRILFISFKNDLIFYLYDDRGCLVFSKNKKLLKELYNEKNDWIDQFWKGKIEKLLEL